MQFVDAKFWKMTTIILMLLSICIMAFYGWTFRTPLFEQVLGAKLPSDNSRVPYPSTTSKNAWHDFISQYTWVEGVNIIRVDFKQNIRATTHRDYKDAEMELSWKQWLEENGATAALFTENEEANQRIINLINGQFTCVPIMQTAAGVLIPAVKDYVVTACSIPIPPGYGDFIGFVNIFLRVSPTLHQIKIIKEGAEKLSLEMYERDIVKSTKRFNLIY